jgi:ankyrin repeat protein
MTRSLPANPSLENLKKQAKTLQKGWSAGAPEAIARIRAVHPQYGGLGEEQIRAIEPRLTDCQLVLARETGFDSWPQLKVAVEAANRELPDEFVTIACLCHDDPHYDHRSFHARAHAMLRDKPWLADANVWSAATAGNAVAVGAFLDEDPALVNRPGPHGWVPLICACYSRVKPVDPAHSTFDVAKLLLDRGADPNAYTLKGNADDRLDQKPRRFTVLSGVFGGGSTGLANQPPHPRWRELAELLLSRGANPADEQALYISQSASLEILLRHGLKSDAKDGNEATLMARALTEAARRGNTEQVKLLLAHGARTDERFQGKIPWEHAVRLGRVEIARLMEDEGATVSELDEAGRFIALCMAGDARGARAMLERAPDLVDRSPKDLVHRAVFAKRLEAVKLLLDLGFDPNYQEDNGAIHHAGDLDERRDILRALLDGGASLMLRDPWYDSTGIGWAHFFDYTDLRDTLLKEPGICLFDALEYGRLDRVPEILARDPEALERPFAKLLSRTPKPEDWQTPLVRTIDRGNTEAFRVLLAHGADSTARHPDGRSLLQLAHDKGFEAIAGWLEQRSASS